MVIIIIDSEQGQYVPEYLRSLSSRRRAGETKVCTNALTKAEQESGDLWVAECRSQSPQQICPRSDQVNGHSLMYGSRAATPLPDS